MSTPVLPSPQPSGSLPRFAPRVRQQDPPPIAPPREIESYRAGYPRLSAFLNSDKDFVLFRRFGTLHTRLLLYKQDELAELEGKLNLLDNEEEIPYNLNSRRDDKNSTRKTLMEEIETKLGKYDEALEAYYRHIERSAPKEQNIESVKNWMDGNKPVAIGESTFLSDKADLTAPEDPGDHGLEGFIMKSADFMHSYGLPKYLTSKEDLLKSTDQHVHFATPSRVWQVSRFLVTVLAVFVLTVPIIVLYYIALTTTRLWAIMAFTALFSSLLSLSTRSRNYEIFSATAAYCAVLVVFVGSIPNN